MNTEWTIGSLKEYFDKLRDADREAVRIARDADKESVKAALIASEKAILKAEGANDDRFKAANEIRGAMRDAQEHFANKGQVCVQIDDLVRRVLALETNDVRATSLRAGASNLWGYLIGGVTLLLAIIVAWANNKLG